jgi:hypothetical protein
MPGMNPLEARKQLEKNGSRVVRKSGKALTNLITGKGSVTRVDKAVPGGSTFFSQIDEKSLPKVIFNWLRAVTSFKEAQISYVGPFDSIEELQARGLTALTYKREVAFPDRDRLEWDVAGGKMEAASKLSDLMLRHTNSKTLLALVMKEDGIYSLTSKIAKDIYPSEQKGETADEEIWVVPPLWNMTYSFWKVVV